MVAEAVKHLAPNKVSSDVVPIGWIRPSSLNPRTEFDETALAELAASIKQFGLLEPIVVRWLRDPAITGTAFEILAGERRWRASKIAGLIEVPIRNLGEVDDKAAIEIALIENLQRVDLNPMDEAAGYASLNRVVGLKQSEIAKAVNRSQPTIANRMRLLELPTDVQERIRTGGLSPSHGVALARFAKFPEIVTALASLVVGQPSSILEKDLPYVWELERKDLIKGLQHGSIFDTAICKESCPFEAYRHPKDSYQGYCLRPAHYYELRNAKMAEFEQNAKTRQAARDAASSEIAADSEVPAVLDTARMSGDQYTTIDRTIEGCTEACTCRAQALRWGRLESVCLNPAARRLLALRQTKAENKARKEEVKALRLTLKAKLADLAVLGPSEWLIISTQALGQPVETHRVSPEWHRLNGETAKTMTLHSTTIGSLDNMAAAQGLTGVAKLVVGAILGGELDAYHEGIRGDAHLTKWYLGKEKDV